MTRQEPNYDKACQWWDDITDYWTPVGWKEHMFRFNVLFHGTILAKPDLSGRTEKWKGQGVQLIFGPCWRQTHDSGITNQGWEDRNAPVLWTEWPSHGMLLRETVFGHVPGARPVESGIEPLFAWIRLSIQTTFDGFPDGDSFAFEVIINAPHISASMNNKNTISYEHELAEYPRGLVPSSQEYDSAKGCYLLEDDGQVRLGIVPGQHCTAEFLAGKPRKRDSLLRMHVDMKQGSHVDILLPMLPTDRAIVDKEAALGYAGALKETEEFWSQELPKPPDIADVEVPEAPINDLIRHSVRLNEIIAERNPQNGRYSILTNSWGYAYLWAVSGAMRYTWLLDTLGYHSATAKYLEMFKQTQGTVTPPGDAFERHAGFLSTPKELCAIPWLTYHGSILWSIAEHVLLRGDDAVTKHWTETIVKACDFIKDARRITAHDGVSGLMPPGAASDSQEQFQGVWTDGWMYKGLTTAVRLLRRVGHPRAEEFAAEAQDYKATFHKAIREKVSSMPTWTDGKGNRHHHVPLAMNQTDDRAALHHCFYLDTGALSLVFAGLLDADDPIIQSLLLWLREGPYRRFYRHDAMWSQAPQLRHEISTAEPHYSWNTHCSHRAGDRQRFLEGMYSLFAGGAISRETFIGGETRGGQFGGLWSQCHAIRLARLSVIDDQFNTDELHLLRLMPLAWLRSDTETRFERVPTEFGPVTLKVRTSEDGRALLVSFTAQFKYPPKRVILNVPPMVGLRETVLNNSPLAWDGKAEEIMLST